MWVRVTKFWLDFELLINMHPHVNLYDDISDSACKMNSDVKLKQGMDDMWLLGVGEYSSASSTS